MDKMKQWIALSVVAALGILAGGWFLLVSPKRADAQTLRDEAASQQRANESLAQQITQLKAQAKQLPAQQAKLAAVAAKIPGNSAMPTLIRALNAAAGDTGVELVSVAPSAPQAAAAAPSAGTVTTPSTSGSTAAAPSTAAQSAAGKAI